MAESLSQAPGPGGRALLTPTGLKGEAGCPHHNTLSVCLWPIRERHSLDSKLSHRRDVVSACLCFLYIINTHKQLDMNINIHEQLFHLG